MNLLVLLCQTLAWAGLTSAMVVIQPWSLRALLLLIFCVMMQGVFSMMHECYHGHGHPSRTLNYAMGLLASILFGTSATLFKINHLGHHVRNRSRAELAEYVFPDESPLKKWILYYVAVFGGIWALGLLGSLAVAVLPIRWITELARDIRGNTYFAAFRDFRPTDLHRIRRETIAGILFWVAVAHLFAWPLADLAWIYSGFAFSWSSLQWVYHMRTPIDVVEGAYNLRLPRAMRLLFLNFNYNLSHHRDPAMPWQELYRRSSPGETRPLWFNYLRIFKAPEPLPGDPAGLRKTYF